MSTEYEEFRAEQDAIDNALDADRESPFAGEDPPEDYLAAEAEKYAQWHREDAHGGAVCKCPKAPVIYAAEAPF
jgi:hypothetical protein